MLLAALAYARRGWPTFPLAGTVAGRCSCGTACPSPGKHPLTSHGLRDATVDERRLRGWGRRWEGANVGLATGPAAGVVVVDVDLPKGGEASLARLATDGLVLPATLTARTGGGGLHLFYRHPPIALRNTAGRLPGAGVLAGIDLRAAGGYVVVAPSTHASGHRYSWVDADAAVEAAPSWLRPPLRHTSMEVNGERRRSAAGAGSRYGLVALERELDALGGTVEGARNDRLNRAAFSLGTLVGGGELDRVLVESELSRVGVVIGLGEREVAATVTSGLVAGEAQPRRAPDHVGVSAAGADRAVARGLGTPACGPPVRPGCTTITHRGR